MDSLITHYQSQHQHPLNKFCHAVGIPMITVAWPLFFLRWRWALVLFIAGWVLQFVGHAIERNRPAFFQNPIYFLVGPWWLMKRALRAIGLAGSSPSK